MDLIKKTNSKLSSKFLYKALGPESAPELDWALKRSKYYIKRVKKPQEMESLCILVQNLASVYFKMKEYSLPVMLMTQSLKYIAFIGDYSRVLFLYTYSQLLLKVKRIEEAKNYCKQCLRILERPVHDNVAKTSKLLTAQTWKKTLGAAKCLSSVRQIDCLCLMLSCYYHLLEIKLRMREADIVLRDLPADLKIAQKGLRLSKRFLGLESRFVKLFEKKIEEGFQMQIKERYTYDTESTRFHDSTARGWEGTPDRRSKVKKDKGSVGDQMELIERLTNELRLIQGVERSESTRSRLLRQGRRKESFLRPKAVNGRLEGSGVAGRGGGPGEFVGKFSQQKLGKGRSSSHSKHMRVNRRKNHRLRI